MHKYNPKFININGVDTRVDIFGSGDAILYLHGASTLEGFSSLESLSDHFRVYCPHHPGMGGSGDAPHIVDMSDMLLHYLNLLDVLGFDRVHLVGFSMGGWMASEIAALARDRFDKVVLVAPAGLNDLAHPATPLSGIAPSDLPGLLAYDHNVSLRYFPNEENLIDTLSFEKARTREADIVERICARSGMGHPNLRHFLARIRNPTFVLWGEKDRIHPASQAPLWKDALPNAQVLEIADAGHLVMQEKPEAIEAIRKFLTA